MARISRDQIGHDTPVQSLRNRLMADESRTIERQSDGPGSDSERGAIAVTALADRSGAETGR